MLSSAYAVCQVGNVFPGHWTIRNEMIGLLVVDLPYRRPGYFNGLVACFLFHRISTIVARTAFVRDHSGLFDKRQNIPGFETNVLHPLVARNLLGNVA